jgi:hypothetical protein
MPRFRPGRVDARGVQYRPVDAALMARECRKLARDLRSEAAAGWPDVPLSIGGPHVGIPRGEAARRLDEQAERWEREATTGERNEHDRALIGG